MDPDPQDTRDYVVREAQGGLEHAIALVERETARLHAAAQAFSDDDLDRQLDGEWTPLVTLRHIVDRSMLRAREVLYVALGGELPPVEENALPAGRDELLARHREAIDSLYEHVRAAPEDFLGFQWEHPTFGPWNWLEWLVFIYVHIEDHARQLEAMAQAR